MPPGGSLKKRDWPSSLGCVLWLAIAPVWGQFPFPHYTPPALFDDQRHHNLAWPIAGHAGPPHLAIATEKKRKKNFDIVSGLKALSGEVRSENRPMGHRRSCA